MVARPEARLLPALILLLAGCDPGEKTVAASAELPPASRVASIALERPRATRPLLRARAPLPSRRPSPPPAARCGRLAVRFFAAGHADSILLRSGPVSLLVDAGRGHAALRDNLVQRRLVPFFRRAAIKRLDALFITHPHFDHFGDLAALHLALPISAVYLNPDGMSWLRPLLAARAYPEPVALKRGDKLLFGCLELRVLNPASQKRSRGSLVDANNNSMVLLVRHGSVRLLLAGDLMRSGERRLLRSGLVGPVDVLKLGHHGILSSSERWLRATKPRYAVATCGDRWSGQMDRLSRRLLSRLRRSRIKLLRTDRDGDVEIISDGIDVRAKTYPEHIFRPKRQRRLRPPVWDF